VVSHMVECYSAGTQKMFLLVFRIYYLSYFKDGMFAANYMADYDRLSEKDHCSG